MARMVFLPKVEPNSWLLWTVSGNGSCLRDYRFKPTKEDRNHSTSDIESLLLKSDHFWEMADQVSYKDVDHWRERISLKNVEVGLPPIENVSDSGMGHRLLSLFISQVLPCLKGSSSSSLKDTFERWLNGFKNVLDKQQFNHWDNKDATTSSNWLSGFGWTSAMLEWCRVGHKLRFISTGITELDFAVISAELCFGISSKANPFQQGKQDYIEPDGIGVRRDGSFVVMEMKGPQDDHDILTALLQALCGALALSAKRDLVMRLASQPAERRPALDNAHFPLDHPSIGLYVFLVQKSGELLVVENDQRIIPAVALIKESWPLLRDITFFVLDQKHHKSINSIPVAKSY